jgi:hypothetical protein
MAYSDAEKMEAIVKLAINRYNFAMTASDTGIPERTLRNWASAKNGVKKGVPELLERAIERMLMSIPKEWHGQEWAVSLGILMDKWLLMQGKATSRTESVLRRMGVSEDELDDILEEADRILEEAAGRGAPEGDSGI